MLRYSRAMVSDRQYINDDSENRRIAILISHSPSEPYASILREFIRPSLITHKGFNFHIYYFVGRTLGKRERKFRDTLERVRYTKLWPILRIYDSLVLWIFNRRRPLPVLTEVERGHQILQTKFPEDLRHIASKLYAAFRFCEVKSFDFVIRTTSNSILNLDRIADILLRHETSAPLYAGRGLFLERRDAIISGSFMFLNRSAIKKLLRKEYFHNYGLLDDVAIGNIFTKRLHIKPVILEKSDYLDLSSTELIEMVSEEVLTKALQLRCKSATKHRDDLAIMLKCASRLNKIGITYV